VGVSFAEIFFGNCVTIGIPCVTASEQDIEWLQKAVGRDPQRPVMVDVQQQQIRFGDRVISATMPHGPRHQLVTGTWDSTAVLLEAGSAIQEKASPPPPAAGVPGANTPQ